ncbi:hypothetical protein ARALYDRAFT_494607 [Arabidopsis lyrata subsp. lyrata]|uniref:Fe2OG dioxygenase domain-containing protein n=1 Tax=Arabidopsis lyrata subsp. lyrata TaxID=81972 RepID=D7MNJ4_ARALL|nr:hypothetical protein ARALYDRAFT_494607 [Arabidopsis lyrata subsp. lyrata]
MNVDKRGETKKIPVVDLSDPSDELVAHAVVKASEEWGILQVVNHGIPADLMRRLQEVGRQFFELPATEKESVTRPVDSQDIEGYFPKDPKHLKAWDDHLIHNIWPPASINYRYWPNNPSDYSDDGFRDVTEEYTRNVTKLTEKIVGLGGDKTQYVMRINCYPPSDLVIGAPAHTDLCALALLVSNEVPGLQVFKDNHWFDVEYINSAVIVLIGDQIMRMSNGRYKNVLHRSIMDKEKTRMSWPVLVEPKHGLVVGPLPELTGDENPPKFESLTFEDYVYRKIKKLLRD